MKNWTWALFGVLSTSAAASGQGVASDIVVAPITEAPSSIPAPTPATPAQRTLAAGTPVVVMMNEEISTISGRLGQRFGVTVLHDVVDNDIIVIPKGTIGQGEVTFRTNKGAFGKPGIIAISLRSLDLAGKSVALDGRYREEGTNNHGATAATWFAVGIFAGFVTGKSGVIPKGRELKARTGEDIVFATDRAPSGNDLTVATHTVASTKVATAPQAIAVAEHQAPPAGPIDIQPK